MVVREWRGRAQRIRKAAYPAHFHQHVVPALRHQPGCLGAELLVREDGDVVGFVVLTRWESMMAIGAFAGSDPRIAVVAPDAARSLISFDCYARHYEVAGHFAA
ncbi:antibiotic biosynthesis monooxygenase family protein [Allosphingosinicella deserti]|uniref:Antibiotic biosynthesis monooxygenase n=1 Tax=Allosphingosinicella deserti TaxID=2116704 RepID=A0A2P7QF20_9SPHN|nr:antibiotic biosynthesis monooxygenase [Sphingomonas deserti]PSJ36515.1 antibiotic biosynthesis monooxygenase [Sphingomonas deserti]